MPHIPNFGWSVIGGVPGEEAFATFDFVSMCSMVTLLSWIELKHFVFNPLELICICQSSHQMVFWLYFTYYANCWVLPFYANVEHLFQLPKMVSYSEHFYALEKLSLLLSVCQQSFQAFD